jgi:hypothetical protein
MKEKNMKQAKLAQVMLETGNTKLHGAANELRTIRASVEKLNLDIRQLELQLAPVDCGPAAKKPRRA